MQSIFTFFVLYTLGLLIGQEIWQRAFTARLLKVTRWGGTSAGIYCVLYGAAGAIIGMAAMVALPNIISADANKDVRQCRSCHRAASGGRWRTGASCRTGHTDVTSFVTSWFGKSMRVNTTENPGHEVRANRIWVMLLGMIAIVLAVMVSDVVAALIIAYDILVGGLLWKRGNRIGTAASMAAGTIVTLGAITVLEIQAKNR
ncbi:hypothetical protein GCM10025778_31380 [Paeniglutamicibacter antarcticus]|uniref:Uncharacterized protein n=1 Tax=Paeniglutamicibacter antarcticus TaxID=494023 RepID=A0ABP9TPC6_9MICC